MRDFWSDRSNGHLCSWLLFACFRNYVLGLLIRKVFVCIIIVSGRIDFVYELLRGILLSFFRSVELYWMSCGLLLNNLRSNKLH